MFPFAKVGSFFSNKNETETLEKNQTTQQKLKKTQSIRDMIRVLQDDRAQAKKALRGQTI